MVLSNENVRCIARICHEANRVYCMGLGDFSQSPWDRSPSWQRVSACTGVVKLMENLGMPPEEIHESWRKHKRAAGWVYGEKKDAEAKTHPCMVPFEQLPPEQQMKDKIFRGICSVLLPLFADPE